MPSFADAAKPWHDLFALMGTASATLVGLLFVAASVGSGVYTRDKHPALRAFLSPSVVHFSSVLAACLVALAPTRSWEPPGLLIGADGLFGLGYAGLVGRSILRYRLAATLDREDRAWYVVVPALGHAMTTAAAVALLRRAEPGCGLLALALGVLMLAGTRNAWDMTVWVVLRRGNDRG